jgi:myo-inositol 2-dehydrogenase / D-chiro-inositol 1-dehydrogenase
MADDLKLVLIGAGWIGSYHLAALGRLGRTRLVGVASARLERAAEVALPHGAVASAEPARLLDDLRPDVAWLCVPPAAAPGLADELVERGIPFLAEKPLAATDAMAPGRIAARIAERRLVVAVGYHLRGLEALPELRERLRADPARTVAGRWLDSTPAPAWWRRVDQGGGQVVEQATHLYDLGRLLAGEAAVVAATSVREEPPVPPDADVADATAAILRYANGALGTFVNSRRSPSRSIALEVVSDGFHAVVGKAGDGPGDWAITIADGRTTRTLPSGRDPYERQAERFLDAVEAGDPDAVYSSYVDAVRTDELTRAVVAATGRPG